MGHVGNLRKSPRPLIGGPGESSMVDFFRDGVDPIGGKGERGAIWVFPKNRDTPKWMVNIMENPIRMDDLWVPLFSEISICIQNCLQNFQHPRDHCCIFYRRIYR